MRSIVGISSIFHILGFDFKFSGGDTESTVLDYGTIFDEFYSIESRGMGIRFEKLKLTLPNEKLPKNHFVHKCSC